MQNSAKQHFGGKKSCYSSKFKFLNSKFEFQASFCITNLKHYIYEASGGVWAPGRPPQTRKRRKTVQNSAKQCKTAFWPLLLAVIFEILNSKMLVLCSTHSQHIRKHISNNFPHLHNVNRGLQTSKSRKNRKNSFHKEIHKGKQANCQKGHFAEAKKRTRRSQKHVTRDKPSFHTLHKPWKTFVHIQSISNEVWKHAKSWQAQFPTWFCGYVHKHPPLPISLQGNLRINFQKKIWPPVQGLILGVWNPGKSVYFDELSKNVWVIQLRSFSVAMGFFPHLLRCSPKTKPATGYLDNYALSGGPLHIKSFPWVPEN